MPPHDAPPPPKGPGRPLPYGLFDLDPALAAEPGPAGRVRCCVRGCGHWLTPPGRSVRGDPCPEHGVYTHRSATYSYADPLRNAIVAPDLLRGVTAHPFKFESGRMGNERGEDALTFNVFRSLQEAGLLRLAARLMTGREVREEPRLYLWGLELGNGLEPWDLLVAARERFERRLPVKRPLTEPDIALWGPGEYLVLCEAKFTSPNPVYARGPRKDAQSLTLEELVGIYGGSDARIVDVGRAAGSDRVAYQLFRNARFAEHMAALDSPRTAGYLCNLTRAGECNDTFEEFFALVRPGFAGRVSHVFWEQLYAVTALAGGRLGRLQRYLLTKTAGLRPAFRLGYW